MPIFVTGLYVGRLIGEYMRVYQTQIYDHKHSSHGNEKSQVKVRVKVTRRSNEYYDCVCGLKVSSSSSSSALMDTERSLAVLLALHAHYLLRSTALSTDERDYSHWLESQFFAGGLQTLHVQNPYEEEKDESRTPSSATTPGIDISLATLLSVQCISSTGQIVKSVSHWVCESVCLSH